MSQPRWGCGPIGLIGLPNWLKFRSECPAVTREAEENGGRWPPCVTTAEIPDAPHVIATAGSYLELIAGFRARQAELGIPYETLDALAGWTTRYASKVLAEEPSRHLGVMAFDALLVVLGLKLVLIHDPEKLEKIRKHYVSQAPYACHWQSRLRCAADYAATLAANREPGRSRARRKASERELSAIGRKAAKARWSRPKLEVKSAPER
jgi:hypothetical protein